MKIKNYIIGLSAMAIVAGIVMGTTGCTKTYSTATDTTGVITQTSQSLIDYLKNNYAFSIFYTGLQRVGLDKQLTNDGKFTLLLPDNDAFARAGISVDSVMTMDTTLLRKWLSYHIVQGSIKYSDIPQTVDNIYYTIDGSKIFFSKQILVGTTGVVNTQPFLHINGDTVNSFDLQASNGYIQVLNRPLPAPIEGSLQDYINANLGTYSLFKQALQKFNLWDSLKNTSQVMTLFAPTNSAFNVVNQSTGTHIIVSTGTIAQWDSTVIPQAVFGIYFMPSRFFVTDLTDIPSGSTSYVYNILPGQTGYLSILPIYKTFSGALLNSSYKVKYATSASILPPMNMITKNGNCVIQPLNQLILIP